MDEPFYHTVGPSVKEVRKDVLDLLKKKNITCSEEIINKIIPEDRNDFGSLRGYVTFNIKEKIAKEVINEINKKN
jgi:hypothetical protein